jgi:hypothetical protein
MTSYRLNLFDGGSRLSLADWIESENDAEAVAKARCLQDGAVRCEVWEGNRLVERLNANDFSVRSLTAA